MFVWKKKYDAVTREMGRQIVERDDTLMVREATIGRLQRTSEDMLARNLELQAKVQRLEAGADLGEQKDEGATYVLKSLADTLHVEDWSIQNGSEEWEGDVWATMFGILIDAGVVEEDHHTVATHAEIAALRPDAEKYRERCRRDREHAENARVRKRAARQEAA